MSILSVGLGELDHIAFGANDPGLVMSRLKESGYEYRDRDVLSMNLFQAFVEDPNGIKIELNYWSQEACCCVHCYSRYNHV